MGYREKIEAAASCGPASGGHPQGAEGQLRRQGPEVPGVEVGADVQPQAPAAHLQAGLRAVGHRRRPGDDTVLGQDLAAVPAGDVPGGVHDEGEVPGQVQKGVGPQGGVQGGEGLRGGDDQDHLLPVEGLTLQLRGLPGEVPQHRVQLPLLQQGQEAVVGGLGDPELQAGDLLPAPEGHPGHEDGASGLGDPHPEGPRRLVGQVGEGLAHGAVQGQEPLAVVQEPLPLGGEPKGRPPEKEGAAQLLLQGGHVGAEGLLGQVKGPGRPGDAPVPGHGGKVAHGQKMHGVRLASQGFACIIHRTESVCNLWGKGLE